MMKKVAKERLHKTNSNESLQKKEVVIPIRSNLLKKSIFRYLGNRSISCPLNCSLMLLTLNPTNG